ncbi:MAG: prepilin-type N-terminal cleavage/methylation domain-containing protein [Deltaproteobacteria bacterium]|nr:prepilin-type N-terminal cleavage/methylation domain-containing protein [Deltaproteobacteria bacterium]
MGMWNFLRRSLRRSIQGGEDGFTLLEILAALAVLAAGLLVLLQTDGLNSRRTLHAARLMGASYLAREKMEGIIYNGVPDSTQEEARDEKGIYTWSDTVTDTEFSGVKEISLTVKWMEGTREESYHVVAYLPE